MEGMTKVNSLFLKWFVSQFGKQPNVKNSTELWPEVLDAEKVYNKKMAEYETQIGWEDSMDTALKAWVARDEK